MLIIEKTAKLDAVAQHFTPIREKYLKSGLIDPKVLKVDVNALRYQVPGGMLSNLISQLKQAGKEDEYYNVLAEIPRVREDFGFPPLVTPTSQIVGTQAVFNVLNGERYKTCTKEFKDIVLGKYGKTPVSIDPDFAKKIIGDQTPITYRPADDLAPELEKLRAEIPAGYLEQDEDVLSYAMFPKVAPKYFEYRAAQQLKVDSTMLDKADKTMPV